MENIAQVRSLIAQWSDQHNQAVLFDEESSTLLDVASGKRVKLSWGDVKAFEEKIHPETGDRYLVLLFESGKQIALVDPGGVAFAPSTENCGPLENLPAVVCLRDFFTLKQRVDHYLYDHPDEPPPRECLDMIMKGNWKNRWVNWSGGRDESMKLEQWIAGMSKRPDGDQCELWGS